MGRRILSSTMLGATLLTMSAAPAGATGYWNTPSSLCQCVGCGRGAGYHAPLILGPISWHGWCAQNERRLPYPPSPPYLWNGCHDCGGDFAAPTIMEPTPTPVAPVVVPTTRRHRPLVWR